MKVPVWRDWKEKAAHVAKVAANREYQSSIHVLCGAQVHDQQHDEDGAWCPECRQQVYDITEIKTKFVDPGR